MSLMCGLCWRCGRGRHSRLELRTLALRRTLQGPADSNSKVLRVACLSKKVLCVCLRFATILCMQYRYLGMLQGTLQGLLPGRTHCHSVTWNPAGL